MRQLHEQIHAEWEKAFPDSITAKVATARFFQNYAWHARSKETADKVTEDGWRRRVQESPHGGRWVGITNASANAHLEHFSIVNNGFSASENPARRHPPAMHYSERLRHRIEKTGSRLCVGLDPRPGDGGASAAREFLSRVVEETAPWAAAFKPNMAYFEAMGIEGIRLLEDLLSAMPDDVPVILDAKRSDIGETQRYYAQGYFAGWNVDAVTLNPFLGYDSIEPFLDWEGKGIYLLAVTSNAGSADFQRQLLADGRSVFELVTTLGSRAIEEGRKTDVGYVVGLTNASGVLGKIPDAPLLVPGLGAQGGDLDSLASAGRSAPDVINVSRGILYAGDDRSYEERAKDWAEKIAAAFAT